MDPDSPSVVIYTGRHTVMNLRVWTCNCAYAHMLSLLVYCLVGNYHWACLLTQNALIGQVGWSFTWQLHGLTYNLAQVSPRSCAQLNYAGICNPGKSFYHTYVESGAVFNYSSLCTALSNSPHIPQNTRRAQTVYCSLTWLRARCVVWELTVGVLYLPDYTTFVERWSRSVLSLIVVCTDFTWELLLPYRGIYISYRRDL